MFEIVMGIDDFLIQLVKYRSRVFFSCGYMRLLIGDFIRDQDPLKQGLKTLRILNSWAANIE